MWTGWLWINFLWIQHVYQIIWKLIYQMMIWCFDRFQIRSINFTYFQIACLSICAWRTFFRHPVFCLKFLSFQLCDNDKCRKSYDCQFTMARDKERDNTWLQLQICPVLWRQRDTKKPLSMCDESSDCQSSYAHPPSRVLVSVTQTLGKIKYWTYSFIYLIHHQYDSQNKAYLARFK